MELKGGEEKLPVRRKTGKYHMEINQYKEVIYLTFPLLEKEEMVRHLFSTRLGGVSKGDYSSMNLSYARGDEKQAVDENFRRITEVMGSTPQRVVCSRQTHGIKVYRVTEEDCGKGTVFPTDYEEADGLITNVPGIILCTSYADCVPLYLVDVKNKAIGLGHSGWRGTVKRMGEKMLEAMKNSYGTDPAHVLAAIGPSICADCYEVGEEVARAFQDAFPGEWQYLLAKGRKAGKFQLDLWEANRRILLDAGIVPAHLEVTDLCTCCNSSLLFSHRASGGKRGNLAAMLELRKS